MKQKMLGFVHTEMQMLDKRAAEERRTDFHEIYSGFEQNRAGEQAGRCSQCGVPFCQVHCPLHNDIPDWLKFTAEGRSEEAYEISSATNTFPEICGRICPQDRLCEGNCISIEVSHYEEMLRELITEHAAETQSRFACEILNDWDMVRDRFWQVVPKEMVRRLEVPISTLAESAAE